MAIRPDEITSVLKAQLEQYKSALSVSNVGSVLQVGDGIARVYGMEKAMSMELVEFQDEDKTLGMVLNLEEDNVGVVILGEGRKIHEGMEVKTTGRIASVPVGPAMRGRVDDVMNVSGHRLSTTEIESALVSHPIVAEAAVVGASDEQTGQAVVAFVILRADHAGDQTPEEASTVLRAHVAQQIGAIARPRQVFVVAELPKTRSGKIMRRLLQDVAEGRELGDTTTLTDTTVMTIITSTVSD